jgi:integral membrane sensor domain MASE1
MSEVNPKLVFVLVMFSMSFISHSFNYLFLFYILFDVCNFGEISIIIIIFCSGFRSLFIDCIKAFVVVIDRKSCCQLGSLFRKVKDIVAYLTLGLKG